MTREEVVPGTEPIERNFVGLLVTFDLHRASKVSRESGQVSAQRWLGFTKRGALPEYELTIIGKSGRSVTARLAEDHVQISP